VTFQTAVKPLKAMALALSLSAPLPVMAQPVAELIDRCAATARDFYGTPSARVNMRYNGARVDGTETIGGEIYVSGRPYIACAFAAGNLAQTEFFIDGRDNSSFLASASTGAGETDTVRVRFDAGSTGAELSGHLAPGATRRYVLGARDGQFLYVRVAPWSGSLEYQIFNPDNSFLLDRVSARQEYRGQLWQSGDHVVEVINRTNSTITYNVVFGVD